MKKIIISFLISISFFSCVNAATLVPSLANQIIRQEKTLLFFDSRKWTSFIAFSY